ncbi:MAG: VanW family protein [Clostridia bacterium]|nr:VanW family protein [Clostridia bacterium]
MKQFEIDSDKNFYHITTVLICLGIILLASLALLVRYVVQVNEQHATDSAVTQADLYNNAYFSNKILHGVTVSGCDVGGMTVQEAKKHLSGNVNYNIQLSEIEIEFEDKSWILDKDVLNLTVDVEYAAQQAFNVGRFGDEETRKKQLETLDAGGNVDISATIIKEPQTVMNALKDIKKEVDIKKVDATVTFAFNNGPQYAYTDEKTGRSLNVQKAYDDLCQLVKVEEKTAKYTLELDVVEPDVKRADIEKEYSLVGSFATTLSVSSKAGRVQNIKTALLSLDGRVWMPGETFSFNQWVGERTIENGFGLGVFINEDQAYDEVVGGGICQVSTTIYYCSLLCGANSVGRNAPIEIIERRPHTWPSVYVGKGLDATVSWPHSDLKLFNNSQTPYFLHTSFDKKGSLYYVNVEIYGVPLPNEAKIAIETEVIEEIQPGEPEYIIDKDNKYNLAPGAQKAINEARTGYTVNVYQIWTEKGKEPVKSLITVSKYDPVKLKIYVGATPET